MSRAPLHALIWSKEQHLYELYIQGQLKLRFRPAEEAAWLAWLGEATSFAFHSEVGSLNVYRERRPRGGAYWYAYQTKEGRTRKRYLGRTETLRLSRLRETAQALWREQQPTQALDQEMLMLSSRLTPPRLPNSLVERERLLSALNGAFGTPLTLLSAPAGWGKTTLLSAWASRQLAQVAWLSLEELDNSPTRFWVALIAALRRGPWGAPQLGETAVELLQSPQPPSLSSLLTTLLHELESREVYSSPIVLILDDYQVIGEQAIHQGITFWVEHQPAHLHLILASRVDPDLPLARWRARGQLTEIRADDLRFQDGEAGQYLGYMLSPPLSEEEVQRLVSRTEGWIAGLHLAALALQKRQDRAAFLQALTGSQRYLLDYVQEDILARLSTNVRDFLLHTAILSRLDASVCQAVTAEPERRNSQQMLALLERANLFLVPLDEERCWYRLHELFREALLAVLHSTHPELALVLHRRAASFYEAKGQWAEAIAHRLEARDYSTAACLMEQTVEQFWLRGEVTTMVRWVLALPQPLVREHARLVLTTALYLLNTVAHPTYEQRTRVYTEVRQLMVRVETVRRREMDKTGHQTSATRAAACVVSLVEDREARDAEDALLHRRLRLLHLFMAMSEALATEEFERLNSMQQEMQELDQDEEAIWQIVPLYCSFLLHFALRQDRAVLMTQLLDAKQRVTQSESRYAAIKVRQWLAFTALEAGQLRLAYQESQTALDLIEHMAGYALVKGYLEIAQVEVLYQWNRLEEARNLLYTLVHTAAAAWQQLDLLAWGYVELLQVALAIGDGSLAELALHEVEQLVQRERFGVYPGWLPTLRAHWWLAQGQLGAASDWAEGVIFPEGPWESTLYDAFPVVIRVYFAQHSFREALDLLERWSEQLDRPTNRRITITYLAQYLVALHQTGKRERSCEIAARLFALTEPEGYLRVYLDEGEPMRETLLALLPPHSKQHELAPSTTTYVSRLLAAFEHKEHKPAVRAGASFAGAEEAPPSSVQGPSSAPLGRGLPISRQELRVLRLLVAGRTYAEMAEELIVSLNTVKTQVSSIYHKLGVSRRAEALAKASRLQLL
jgi:LuxR family maltose regulon positive regulatory protein